ncbi:MAG: hypothetical protein ABJO01_12860 [Parasphingorhabdus sp.]|uniref:hypothetical protein n=1 Tax=Parasphingorhabdus sp. TaxID=2709688 RepID=UPI003298BCE8
MEMNFPHKSVAETSAESNAKADNAHEALIAHAVARQAQSPSARAFLARQTGKAANKAVVARGLMEDRIKYFAGELPSRSAFAKRARIFDKGHFRPDLLRDKSSDKSAG